MTSNLNILDKINSLYSNYSILNDLEKSNYLFFYTNSEKSDSLSEIKNLSKSVTTEIKTLRLGYFLKYLSSIKSPVLGKMQSLSLIGKGLYVIQSESLEELSFINNNLKYKEDDSIVILGMLANSIFWSREELNSIESIMFLDKDNDATLKFNSWISSHVNSLLVLPRILSNIASSKE